MRALRRLWNVVRWPRLDDELRQKLETHLALIEEEERAKGSTTDEARRNARSRLGNPLVYRERAVDGGSGDVARSTDPEHRHGGA